MSGGSTLWLAENVLGVRQGELFDVAAAAPAGSDGVLFLPTLCGATAPRWNDRVRGVFAGLSLNHGGGHLARAVLEGCAFALRDIVVRLDAMGLGGPEIRVVGGGARSPLWMQIKADVTGQPGARRPGVRTDRPGRGHPGRRGLRPVRRAADAVARVVALAPEPTPAAA